MCGNFSIDNNYIGFYSYFGSARISPYHNYSLRPDNPETQILVHTASSEIEKDWRGLKGIKGYRNHKGFNGNQPFRQRRRHGFETLDAVSNIQRLAFQCKETRWVLFPDCSRFFNPAACTIGFTLFPMDLKTSMSAVTRNFMIFIGVLLGAFFTRKTQFCK